MNQRIKGEEVVIAIVVDGEIQSALTAIKDFEVTPKFEIKEEEYLGETTPRYDEIKKGVSGSMTVHLDSKDAFNLYTAVDDRATRRSPSTKINIQAVLNFPNGDSVKVVCNDVFFGDMPINAGSRSDYVSKKLSFSCGTVDII